MRFVCSLCCRVGDARDLRRRGTARSGVGSGDEDEGDEDDHTKGGVDGHSVSGLYCMSVSQTTAIDACCFCCFLCWEGEGRGL
jgi:hypothetical protein